MRRSALIPLLVLLASLGGCLDSQIDRIDSDVQATIRQFQRDALGVNATNDANIVPPSPRASGVTADSYRTDLSTVNPPASDLPATPIDAAKAFDPAKDIDSSSEDTQEPAIELDLEGALEYAIRDSREYRTRKEDLYIAALDLLIEKHLWGPRFFNTLTADVSGAPEAGDHDQALSLVNDFTVTQRLPYGGDVSVSALVNFVEQLRSADPASNPEGGSQAASLVFSGNIPLLRGAGDVAREPLIQAYRDLTYSARNFERFRREFLVDIASSYYSLLRQQSEITNLKQQLANFVWLSERTEALANAGRVPFFEVQRAQQSELFAKNNLINANEQYRNSLDLFKIRLGIPVTRGLVIKPAELEVPAPALEPNSAVETAWKYRLDLQIANDQIDDARRGVAIAKNDLLPDLNLTGSLSLNTDPEKRRAGAAIDAGASRYSAGATFGAPLDRRIEYLRYRQSLITLERSTRSHGLLRDQVALEVRASIRDIRQAGLTLALQNRNIETAETRLRGVQLRLRELGPRDFVEAQDDLLEALNRRDAALRNLRVAVLTYLLDSGQLRVTGKGQWLPPAKLVAPNPQKQLPDARDLMRQPNRNAPAALPAPAGEPANDKAAANRLPLESTSG